MIFFSSNLPIQHYHTNCNWRANGFSLQDVVVSVCAYFDESKLRKSKSNYLISLPRFIALNNFVFIWGHLMISLSFYYLTTMIGFFAIG